MARRLLLSFAIFAIATTASADITIKATNKLQIPRHQETIEVPSEQWGSVMPAKIYADGAQPSGPDAIIVKDESGKELLSQGVPPLLVFQADFAPGETKTFSIIAGNALGIFTVNPSTGAITILSNTNLVGGKYTLTVRCVAGNCEDFATVVVTATP